MSRRKKENFINGEFAIRFQEACKTSQPAEIQRAFGISYQAAKNYINGKYPETDVLLTIAKQTGVSLHWLLTGEGPKTPTNEVSPFYWIEKKNLGEMANYIRNIFEEELRKYFPEKFASHETSIEEVLIKTGIVRLSPKDILDEKLLASDSAGLLEENKVDVSVNVLKENSTDNKEDEK